MTTTQFLALIGLIKDETTPKGNTKTRIGDAILESSKQANTYSTNETVIGTWDNGKPIYRRVFINNSPIVDDLDLLILNSGLQPKFEDIARFEAILYCTIDGIVKKINHIPFSSYGSNPNYVRFLDSLQLDSNEDVYQYYIEKGASVSTLTLQKIQIIIEYTKTTDSIPE
jgi:hypothetical protein